MVVRCLSGAGSYNKIPTFGDSQGVFKVETAMFWLELSSHLGEGVKRRGRIGGQWLRDPLPRRIYSKPGADPQDDTKVDNKLHIPLQGRNG